MNFKGFFCSCIPGTNRRRVTGQGGVGGGAVRGTAAEGGGGTAQEARAVGQARKHPTGG